MHNSHSELLPTSRPSRPSSALVPILALAKSELPDTTKGLWGAPCQPSPAGMGPPDGCRVETSEEYLQGSQKENSELTCHLNKCLNWQFCKEMPPLTSSLISPRVGVFLFSRAWEAPSTELLHSLNFLMILGVCLVWKTQISALINVRAAVQHLCTVQALPAIVSTICSAQCSETSSLKQPFTLHFTLLGGLC